MSLGELPVDILVHIASLDIPTYCAMLAIPAFARALLSDSKQSDQLGKKIRSGFIIKIVNGEETIWKLNGLKHREKDGGETPPAVIWCKGIFSWCKWYRYGKLHRSETDAEGRTLPAVEYCSQYREWWLHGERHRADGPAIIYSSGEECWYLYGEHYREEGPGPCINTNKGGNWYQHNKSHRIEVDAKGEVLPAEINKRSKYWYQHDTLHRIDGPAAEFETGGVQYWVYGIVLS